MKKVLIVALITINLARAFAQPNNARAIIKEIDNKLSQKQTTLSAILTDVSLMHLHSLTEFREIIKKYAVPEKLTIVSNNEPGIRVIIQGKLLTASGQPEANALLYVYQTDNKGWYSDTGGHILVYEGDRGHARLFGWLKTDKEGRFEFNTIKPVGYPKSDLPAHIHLEATTVAGNRMATELLFDDDPRLSTDAARERARREGFYISKNNGRAKLPVYEYEVKLAH